MTQLQVDATVRASSDSTLFPQSCSRYATTLWVLLPTLTPLLFTGKNSFFFNHSLIVFRHIGYWGAM